MLKPYIWPKCSRILLNSHTIAGLCLFFGFKCPYISHAGYRSAIACTRICNCTSTSYTCSYMYLVCAYMCITNCAHGLRDVMIQLQMRHALICDNSMLYAPFPLCAPGARQLVLHKSPLFTITLLFSSKL